jgi:hypothetical protein
VIIMQSPAHRFIGHVTRRATVGLGLSAVISSLAPIGRTRAQTSTPDDLQVRFLRWSRTATGFADLPADVARACMELLLRSGVTPASLSALEPDAYRGTALRSDCSTLGIPDFSTWTDCPRYEVSTPP